MMGYRKIHWFWGLIIINITSCTYYKNEIYIPPVEEKTQMLEAEYVTNAPTNINDPYWKTADYIEVYTNEKQWKQVYDEDGLLNMNSMYNGKTDFNGGDSSHLELKAAYDDTYIYILASWQDKTYNASYANWVFNGPHDQHKPAQDTIGWTSQRNDDNLIFAFDKSNGRDIWKWSLSTSEPTGYALDMHEEGAGWTFDGGTPVFERNAIDPSDNRSGPKYEWNGPKQELVRIPGVDQSFAQLDPGYYILDKSNFMGDIENGEYLFQTFCAYCHGRNGLGDGYVNNTGIALNVPAWLNRYTRDGYEALIGNSAKHPGASNWNRLTEERKIDLGARLRAFAGVPGVVFQEPTGSSADIRAYSNVILGNIDINKENPGYKVLFIRKLQTGNDDDIQFNLGESAEYDLNIFFTDNDDLNYVGEDGKKLIFKRK